MPTTQANRAPKPMGVVALVILWASPVLQAFMSNAPQPHFGVPAWAYLPLYITYTLGGWITIATGFIACWHSLEFKTCFAIVLAQSAGASIATTLTALGNTTFNDFLCMMLPLALLHVGMVLPFAMFAKFNMHRGQKTLRPLKLVERTHHSRKNI